MTTTTTSSPSAYGASGAGSGSRPRCDLLARLSDKREDVDLTDEGIPAGLDDQIQRMRQRADELGWEVVKVIKNPRLSAYKRRKVTLPDGRREYRVWRPDLREALADLASGRADALLCLDLDRAFRDPKDLEDLIDVVEYSERLILVDSVTGSLRMEKGQDNFDARIRVLVANKASRDTARRVANARERQARNGQYGGGPRPYGFCLGPPKVPDGTLPEDVESIVCEWHGGRDCRSGITPIEQETTVIADCSHRLLQGVSLRALAAELRSTNEPTVTGAPWTAETLRTVLLRPRNAGVVVYRGEILEDVTAPWDPIVTREVFEAVRALLTDPSRRKGPGAAPRWLGTGIYRCGICTPPETHIGKATGKGKAGKPVTVQVLIGGRSPRYKCKDHTHLARNVEFVDREVLTHLLAAFTHPRAYELLRPPPPDVDAKALRAEQEAISTRLDQLAEDEVLGLRKRRQVLSATRAGNARIEEIDQLLNANMAEDIGDPLAEVIKAADPLAAWEATPLASKRVIIDRLVTVTILPAGHKGPGFDPSTVNIEPKHHLDLTAAT